MKVFISWSGTKSNKVAMVFRNWLPYVIQTIEPYVSSEDIDKGARWSTDIAKELEDCSFGILCVTKDNINAPWLNFEAGALSKTMDKAVVTPFLFDIKRSEVNGPILQFQSTIFEKDDIKKLILSLNKACGDRGLPQERLENAFKVWYPTLENDLNSIKENDDEITKTPDEEQTHTIEVIEEILDLSRANQKLLKNPDPKLYENIDGLKKDIGNLSLKFDQKIEQKATVTKNQAIDVGDIMDLLPDDCPKIFEFIVELSTIEDQVPWLYRMGETLISVLLSQRDNETKLNYILSFHKTFVNMIKKNSEDHESLDMNKSISDWGGDKKSYIMQLLARYSDGFYKKESLENMITLYQSFVRLNTILGNLEEEYSKQVTM